MARAWRSSSAARPRAAGRGHGDHVAAAVVRVGQNVYFEQYRAPDPGALPLILTHGWPGSTAEFRHLIPLLRDRFHLVIPAIPGFGFSRPTTATGWGQERVARAWATLMDRLGYRRYGAHGGDWGSGISRLLGALAPDRVAGVHVNYLPTRGAPDGLSPRDLARLERTLALAGTRHPHQWQFLSAPQTIAYALNDSPAGLLAYLGEKFTTWADRATPVPDEDILTDVSRGAATSPRWRCPICWPPTSPGSSPRQLPASWAEGEANLTA